MPVSYSRVHVRLGPAKLHSCVDCGRTAKDWSYIGGAPDELLDKRGMRYSELPEYYQPRCKDCHAAYDKLAFCPSGHEYTEENTYIRPNGERWCRECRRIRERGPKAAAIQRERRAERRAAKIAEVGSCAQCGVELSDHVHGERYCSNGCHKLATVTHCPSGHEYNEANTHITKNGKRMCRTCSRERARARRERVDE